MKTLSTTLALGGILVAQSGAAVIWNAGKVDNLQQFNGGAAPGPGGGGENVRFIQERDGVTALPGSATNTGGTGGARDVDDDYYFAGVYTTQVDGGAAYSPIGTVASNEENMERAFTNGAPGAGDRDLRYHFNFPSSVSASDLITINWGITGMEGIGGASGWDVDVKINGVLMNSQGVSNVANQDFTTPSFTLGDINGTAGPGFDNYVEISGTSRVPAAPATAGGSRWLSIDYVEMDVSAVPEPTPLGFLALTAAGIAILARRRK
ncbi:MAG: hypothetical protein P8J87_21700 [Verrucomicrobiales bacterium]|nr:hypothetical protein [Verrucomicrobiales bacterium]